jgi:hypothetical protein
LPSELTATEMAWSPAPTAMPWMRSAPRIVESRCAITIRWRCPPDKVAPPSVMNVCIPIGIARLRLPALLTRGV